MEKDYKNLKKQAIKLRKQGLSYNEIKQKIDISKSTLSGWLKAILLKPEHRKRLYTLQIDLLSRGPQSQRERRLREIDVIIRKAEGEIAQPLSLETQRLMGAALYWGEGSKGRMTQITNSDPFLILFMVRWIKLIFGIPPEKLKTNLNIYPQQNEKELKNFWSDLTGIPTKNFGKSYVKPASKGYKKNNLYYGTMRIDVPKSANMRHQIFGWIKGALKNIETYVNLTQEKWHHLSKVSRPVNLEE